MTTKDRPRSRPHLMLATLAVASLVCAAAAPAFAQTAINISGRISYCSNPVPDPVPDVTLDLTGDTTASTMTDGPGNYTFTSLASGGNYTVTPNKAALTPGSAGIDTFDVMAVQRHYLTVAPLPPGCGRDAADVNGDGRIDTGDVVAIQRFFVSRPFGFANVGQYQFTPASRIYTSLVINQTDQDYDALVFGDVVGPFVPRRRSVGE